MLLRALESLGRNGGPSFWKTADFRSADGIRP